MQEKICTFAKKVDMTGFNSYINGLDLSALNEYFINHGRLTQYAKGDAYVTKRWHLLAIINKNLPYRLYKRM